MPSRYRELSDALLGYRNTGVSLVASDGKTLAAAGALDDLGSYCLIPWIAARLKLPLNRTIDIFYFSLLLLALVIGTVGFFLNLSTKAGGYLSVIWLSAVVLFAYHAGDVYILSAVVPVAVIPWLMRASERWTGSWVLPTFLFVEGLTVGVAHTVRSHSATALLIFTLCILLFQVTVPKARKVWLVAVLLAGVLVPQLYLHALVTRRDAFLASACPRCLQLTNQHPFWHSVYVGFGFLSNEYVPGYDDTVAFAKVQAVAPGTTFGSPEYERVLRQEVFALFWHHPVLVATTMMAKAGVIFGVFLIVANVGLLAAARYRKPWPIELGFVLAIAFSSLPGLLVIPSSSGYMLGLITFASLYAVSSIDFALSNATASGFWQTLRWSSHKLPATVSVSPESDPANGICTRARRVSPGSLCQ